MTTLNTPALRTVGQPWQQFHVWSKVWPSPNRRYEGLVWARDAAQAAVAARELGGPRRTYDIQGGVNGPILLKSA